MGTLFGPFSTPGPVTLSTGTQASPEGVGLAGSLTDQYTGLINQWNQARLLSKPEPVRRMMLLRQKGQGGTFDTEALALEARLAAARNLNPADFDELIDVYHAGFNAFETLSLRSMNPFGGASNPMPDLSKPPAPASDLTSSGPQPFSEWIAVHAWKAGGIDDQYDPLPTDTSDIGATWSGIAKRTATAGQYQKKRFLPFGQIQDRWVRIS